MQSLCACGTNNLVDYTENILRDVLVAGSYNMQIHREVLGIEGLTGLSTNDVIAMVEKKEMARDANTSANVFASGQSCSSLSGQHVSNSKVRHPPPGFHNVTPVGRNHQVCPQCSKLFVPFSEGIHGMNTKPHKLCKDCHVSNCTQSRNEKQGTTFWSGS